MARAMCDRHFGVGGDGLILVLPSDEADFRMRIFNPDGSEAEMCGNGIRCFAKYVVEEGLAPPETSQLNIETLAGVRTVWLTKEGNEVRRVRVSMGEPEFSPDRIPVWIDHPTLRALMPPVKDYPVEIDGKELRLTCLSMGNPHAVHFIDYPVDEFPLLELGPKVENHLYFPNRVNFEVVQVVDRSQVEARVWERGAGPTLACGTGACAVAVAAHLHDLVEDEVDVRLPGGTLHLEWGGEGEVFLSGPAETVFRGEWVL